MNSNDRVRATGCRVSNRGGVNWFEGSVEVEMWVTERGKKIEIVAVAGGGGGVSEPAWVKAPSSMLAQSE